ncbi:MAG: hypothetical protein ACTTIV_01825 [Campylobacter sp.]
MKSFRPFKQLLRISEAKRSRGEQEIYIRTSKKTYNSMHLKRLADDIYF